jgi:hypothetical protein
MGNYDWPKIMSNKTNQELKQILNSRNSEPKIKIEAAIEELRKRGLIDSANKLKKEVFINVESLNENSPILYSKNVIYIFSLLFSLVFGGVLFAINLNEVNKRKGILPVMLFSVLFTGFIILIHEKLKDEIIGAFLLNAVGAMIIIFLFWNKYIGSTVKYYNKKYKKPLIIALIIFAPLLVFVILSMT